MSLALPARLGVILALLASLLVAAPAVPATATTGDLLITGVIDGPLSGGIPKAVELYANVDIADLADYEVVPFNNANVTSGAKTVLSGSATAGEFLYVSSEGPGFEAFLGFAPDFVGGVSVNGDDTITLQRSGEIVDQFGVIGTDGTGQPWEYMDGWAYRTDGTGADGDVFQIDNWTLSGPNTLDGETANATATTPWPVGTYAAGDPGDAVQPTVLNELLVSHTGTDDTEFLELFGTPGASLTGLSLIGVENDAGSSVGSIDFRLDLAADAVIGDNGFLLVGVPAGLDANYGVIPNIEIDANALENSSATYALVETASLTGSAVTGAEVVLDAVALTDGGVDDAASFGAPVVGPDGSFLPAGARRVVDGVDTDTAADFVIGDFGLGLDNTPTAGSGIAPPPPPIREVLISQVQGSGDATPLDGALVTIEAVVVGDFQDGVAGTQGDLNGFYLQEEDADADTDPATSEGLFVFNGSSPSVDVAVGDRVRVTGEVSEFRDQTQVAAFDDDVEVLAPGVDLPTPAELTLPFESVDFPERFEGMRVAATDLYVAEYFNLDRFGEMVLTQQASGLITPTQVTEPGSVAYEDLLSFNQRSQITLDDGRTVQNPDPIPFVDPNLSEGTYDDNRRRGDRLDELVGVLGQGFGRYRIQVDTDVVTTGSFTTTIERPGSAPDVGGDVAVASFNVLNYFTTIDRGGATCGPLGNGCRGADDQPELERQTAKTVTALAALDADVVGLIEIENDGDDSSVSTLVDGLNDRLGDGTYDYVATGFVGSDAIKQALIYRPGVVTPVGDPAVLDTPEFINGLQTTPKNRAALAQTFVDDEGGAVTVVVNHFKSKGSSCGAPDDATDGSGNCDGTRTRASELLLDWVQDETNGFAEDVLVIGDLNSYARERPIQVFIDAGFVNTVLEDDPEAYGFVFDAQQGTLDYALASATLAGQVTGSAEYGINADEADLIDYNTDFGRDPGYFNPAIPFRASDHDPVITGLDLVPTSADAGGSYEVRVDGSVELDASASTDGSGLGLTYAWDLDGDGAFEDAVGETVVLDPVGGPPGRTTIAVEVTDPFGSTSVDEAGLVVLANGRGNDGRPKGRYPRGNVR